MNTAAARNSPLRLCILPDFPEENWPSMDLCAEMLTRELAARGGVSVERFVPRYVDRFGRWRNADRFVNRLREYPRQLRGARLDERFDGFHLVDHSYSQLLHVLPPGRTGVFCHDLDTFRCLIEPHRDRRPLWFRAMVRRILRGLQTAAVVFHSTQAVRQEIVRFGLVDPAKLVHAPLGIAGEFAPQSPSPAEPPFVLHVGSCIPRKRIDVLLAVFESLARRFPQLRFIQVGGEWDESHRQQLSRIGEDRVQQFRGRSRSELAALYSSAALLMLPSEAEGFGLPVIEAIACGATVLASDLPVLREVAADAAVYAPVGDIAAWTAAATELLERRGVPSDEAKRTRAARFSWREHAATVLNTYHRILA
jgi:glycosyltransferase involved in cell wall biosynthesis